MKEFYIWFGGPLPPLRWSRVQASALLPVPPILRNDRLIQKLNRFSSFPFLSDLVPGQIFVIYVDALECRRLNPLHRLYIKRLRVCARSRVFCENPFHAKPTLSVMHKY
jgi:hypothetical protein